jgi:hypothetical protein
MDPNLILDESEKTIQPLTAREVFTKIWLSPREVFQFIIEYSYSKHTTVLVILASIARQFDRMALNNKGDESSLGFIILMCILSGVAFGWIYYQILASLVKWTGGWIGGKATDSESVFRVLAYASCPLALTLILLVPEISIFGIEVFKEEGNLYSNGIFSQITFFALLAIKVLLGIATLILTVIGISEVQQFGIGKAILNILLPVLVFIIPITLIVLVFTRI